MKLHTITFILLIVGGLNWLVFGLFGQDVGSLLGGMSSVYSKAVYVLVGLSALFEMFTHKGRCKSCGSSGMGQM